MKVIQHHIERPVEGSRLKRRKLPMWARVYNKVRNVFSK